jgi:hypothetical protein
MIVASMATLPHRRDIALRAVASLLPQVDRFTLWLDKHTTAEALAAEEMFFDVLIAHGRSDESQMGVRHGDLGDGGKFEPLPSLPDDTVWLICDDDIEYPSDYAVRMTTALHQAEGTSDGPCVVGLHALRLPETCKDYRRQRTHVQHCLRYDTRPEAMTRAHVLGTSSVVTRPRYLRGFEAVDVTDPPNVGDLHLAAFCERQGIPRYCLPLPRDRWLGNLLPDGAPCIWSDRATKNENRVVSSVTWGPLA